MEREVLGKSAEGRHRGRKGYSSATRLCVAEECKRKGDGSQRTASVKVERMKRWKCSKVGGGDKRIGKL